MTTRELLAHLRKLNVTLSADNGQLLINGPKGALTATLRAELIACKAQILKFLPIAAACRAAPTEPRLRCVARDKDFPLSFAQQRLWFLDQLEPGSTVYNVPVALRVKGPLDAGILKQSLEEIVRRHEVLRTTFSIVEGEPVQVIAPSLSVSLPVVDISHFSDSEREEEAIGYSEVCVASIIVDANKEHTRLTVIRQVISESTDGLANLVTVRN